MKVFLGADHRGFELKEVLKKSLQSAGYEVEDKGAFEKKQNDDYPDFAHPVARAVAVNPGARGILLCGSGMGMDVVANKVKGVRATVAYSLESVVHARTNDDINVITLAADVMNVQQAQVIVELFLKTPFSNEERHLRRLAKITAIENER